MSVALMYNILCVLFFNLLHLLNVNAISNTISACKCNSMYVSQLLNRQSNNTVGFHYMIYHRKSQKVCFFLNEELNRSKRVQRIPSK